MAGTSNMLNSGMTGNSSCSSNFNAKVVESHDMIKVESCDVNVACYGKFGSLGLSFTKGKTPVQEEQDFYLKPIIQLALF